jgi:hypothetical protein
LQIINGDGQEVQEIGNSSGEFILIDGNEEEQLSDEDKEVEEAWNLEVNVPSQSNKPASIAARFSIATVKLPTFSDAVKRQLESKEVLCDAELYIQEAAAHLINKVVANPTKKEYSIYCEALIQQNPVLAETRSRSTRSSHVSCYIVFKPTVKYNIKL